MKSRRGRESEGRKQRKRELRILNSTGRPSHGFAAVQLERGVSMSVVYHVCRLLLPRKSFLGSSYSLGLLIVFPPGSESQSPDSFGYFMRNPVVLV